MVRQGEKKHLKSQPSPSGYKDFEVFSNPIPSPPPHLTISFWYFFQPSLLFHIPIY